MPELTKTPEAAKTKTQPWRAVWPAPESASNVQMERKPVIPQSGGSGSYGYNDQDEGIPPKKK